MLYTDFIRKKMHNLLKIITAGGYPLKIISKFNRKAVDYVIHGKTQCGKNLLPYPFGGIGKGETWRANGITVTDNGDGSVTVNGTATNHVFIHFLSPSRVNDFKLPLGKYTVTGCTCDEATAKLSISTQKPTAIYEAADWKDNVATINITKSDYSGIWVVATIYPDAACDNLVIRPMLEAGDVATEYEPYTEYGVGDKTKNLLPYPFDETTKTINGITFTDNGDGTITANGTATARAQFRLHPNILDFLDKNKKYMLSGNPGSAAIVCEFYLDNKYVNERGAYGNSRLLDFPSFSEESEYDRGILYINISKGSTVNNLVFNPMIELGETASEYEPYSEYDYKIPLKNTGKNLLPYPFDSTTNTANGITFTDNGDGSITVNGAAEAGTIFVLGRNLFNFLDKDKKYTISGNTGGLTGVTSFVFEFYLNGKQVTAKAIRGYSGVIDFLSISKEYEFSTAVLFISMAKGAVINNLVFNPMIEDGDIETEYEPYRNPEITTAYANSQLKYGESISFRNGGLPQLQLYKGENNITVETDVKPSGIDIKYFD